MYVKVIKAREETYWYAKHIGEVFEVNSRINRHNEYELLEMIADSIYSIDVDDCEVVK